MEMGFLGVAQHNLCVCYKKDTKITKQERRKNVSMQIL